MSAHSIVPKTTGTRPPIGDVRGEFDPDRLAVGVNGTFTTPLDSRVPHTAASLEQAAASRLARGNAYGAALLLAHAKRLGQPVPKAPPLVSRINAMPAPSTSMQAAA